MKPLDYTRILTGPMEDTRRVVTLDPPPGQPDERGVYRLPGWRGVRTKAGGGMWQTEHVWGGEITSPWIGDEGDRWHVTRRDIAVDVECPQVPEPWWREYFAGLRGRKRRFAVAAEGPSLPGEGMVIAEVRYDTCAGTGASHHTGNGDTEYFGSRRSPCYFRIYVKYLRPGVGREIRQVHLDTWTRNGWRGGMVLRVEAVLSPPTELGVTSGSMRQAVTPAELFSDAAARIRLLEHPPEGRGCNVPTAARWVRLGRPVKLQRPEATAPDDAAAKLRRALEKLQAEHGRSAIHAALLTIPKSRK